MYSHYILLGGEGSQGWATGASSREHLLSPRTLMVPDTTVLEERTNDDVLQSALIDGVTIHRCNS